MASGAMVTSNPTATSTSGTDYNNYLEQLLPGISGLQGQATSAIGNLLGGLPSPSASRTANAYFGAGSGMGAGSQFLQNRGEDLYNQKAAQNQQTGLGDLTSLLGATTSPALQYQGQQLQNQQFGQQLGQNASEFSDTNQLAQFNAMLNALGMGQSIAQSGNTSSNNLLSQLMGNIKL
jgi:hypothetical protein